MFAEILIKLIGIFSRITILEISLLINANFTFQDETNFVNQNMKVV